MKRFKWLVATIALATASLSIAAPARAGRQSSTLRLRLDGEQWFRAYCSPCHGLDGKGHGPAASGLKTVPADLTMITARNGGTFPRAFIAELVANGRVL